MKTICYPGNHRQPCFAEYSCLGVREESFGSRVKVMFVESNGDKNIGGTFCNNFNVPIFLMNKILETELRGVSLSKIDFYYAGVPDQMSRRVIYEWKFEPDLIDYEKKGGACEAKVYSSMFNELKAKFMRNISPVEVRVNGFNIVGGSCAVLLVQELIVNEDERMLLKNMFEIYMR